MWKLKYVKGYFALSRYTYDFHENWPIFKAPTPLSSYVQRKTNPRPSPNYNQSVKRKHNPRMTIMLSGLSFRSAFVFSINSLILSGFPLTFIHLAETNLVPRAILKN